MVARSRAAAAVVIAVLPGVGAEGLAGVMVVLVDVDADSRDEAEFGFVEYGERWR